MAWMSPEESSQMGKPLVKQKQRKWFKPDKLYRKTHSPSGNYYIKYFWGDCFETTFISLLPFYRPLQGHVSDLEKLLSLEDREEYYKKLLDSCEPVTWNEVLNIFKLKSWDELNVRLTGTDRKNTKQWWESLSEKKLLSPKFYGFGPLHIEGVLKTIKNIGFKTVQITDELDQFKKTELELNEYNIQNFSWINTEVCVNIFPKTHNWLITRPYDAWELFISGSKDLVGKIVKENNLEGFYADKNTTFWWAQPHRAVDKYDLTIFDKIKQLIFKIN